MKLKSFSTTKNTKLRALCGSAMALGLCAFALNSPADPPTSTVNPRNAILFNGYFDSNAVPAVTNIPSSWTNIYLSAPYQHNISVTTVITGTNQIVPAALNHTNYFDLGKIVITNNGTSNVYTTNWSGTNGIISVITTGNGNTNSMAVGWIYVTNFDGYELIRLSKMGENSTNNYVEQVILGQTP